MKFNEANNVMTLYFEGRIDSSNASAVGQECDAILAKKTAADVVIDAENLEYLSSAGLRVVLGIRKKFPDVKMVNVSSDVYEIFDMTGFTEMMTIEKAYRVIDVEGCEVIGQGANGKVYRIDPDTIVKVYLNPDSLPDIHRERELARRAFVLGVNTAIPYDVVKVRGGGYGSVFELLNAKSLAKLIATDPDNLDTYIGYSVELLKTIHSKVVNPEDMPDMKAVAVDWAKFMLAHLPEAEGKKLVAMIEAVPEDMHMMHGDYHVKNVMVQNGEVLLIDMDTLCHGAPVFEFASIFNAYVGFHELDQGDFVDFLGISKEAAGRVFLKTVEDYFGTTDAEKVQTIIDKARIVGYTRLIRRNIRRGGLEKDPAAIEHYRNALMELIRKYDDLSL